MVYFTHTRLMSESEGAVRECAESGIEPAKHVCAQLRQDSRRYTTWVAMHDRHMWGVVRSGRRDHQVRELRLVASLEIHRAALVRHLRDNERTRPERERLLQEFYGSLDSSCATLAEHRAYTRAVSSQVSALELLELTDDRVGLQLLEQYQRDYGSFFSMYCDRLLAIDDGRPYLLASLLPEVRANANRLRRRILACDEPPRRLFFSRPNYQYPTSHSKATPVSRST